MSCGVAPGDAPFGTTFGPKQPAPSSSKKKHPRFMSGAHQQAPIHHTSARMIMDSETCGNVVWCARAPPAAALTRALGALGRRGRRVVAALLRRRLLLAAAIVPLDEDAVEHADDRRQDRPR